MARGAGGLGIVVKAAVLVRQNAPLEVVDVDIPALDVGQVLVSVAYAGICGKQLDEISGKQGKDPHLPHLMGHEGSGIVESVGPGVRKVRPGDHVVIHWVKGSGIDSLPPRYKGLLGPSARDWCDQISAGWCNTWAECCIASENRVTQVPCDVPLDVAALLGCAVTTGFGIVYRQAQLMPGQSVCVFGAGGVGLSVIKAANLLNAYPIYAVDKSDEKCDFAIQVGADFAPSTPADLAGFDLCVDTTGVPEIREWAYSATGDGGKCILAGVPTLGSKMTIDSFPLHHGRTLIGSHGGDTQPDVDIPRYLGLSQGGLVSLRDLITERVRLENINNAVGWMFEGMILGRCLIDMGSTDASSAGLSRRLPWR